MSPHTERSRAGRPPVTSRDELERVALELFARKGFAATTVEEIATAASVSRRTFFRYFPSKKDVVWGDFGGLLRNMEDWFGSVPAGTPLLPAVADAVVRFNTLPPDAVASHRRRMALILGEPELQAHSTIMYADWRGVVARFAARRLDLSVQDLGPRLIGHLALGAALAAYEQWLAEEGADLSALLAEAFAALRLGWDSRRPMIPVKDKIVDSVGRLVLSSH